MGGGPAPVPHRPPARLLRSLDARSIHSLAKLSSSFFKYFLSHPCVLHCQPYQGASRSILTKDDAMTQVYTCSWTKAVHSLKYSSFFMLLEAPRYGRRSDIEYRSDDVMAICYSIVMVPNKRSLHQASGSGLEPGTCIVSNHCNHWSSDCLNLFRTSFHVDEKLWCHTLVLYTFLKKDWTIVLRLEL